MDIYTQLAEKIIREQETIIGPVALEQAQKVRGLKVDSQLQHISIEGNKKEVLNDLVKQYELLFGQTSVEVCREAVKSIISQVPKEQVPPVLL